MSKISDKTRREFKAGDDIRDAGLTTPNDVVRFDDIRYGDDDPLQALDVYRPRAAEGKVLPVIISVHGGGWVYGDKERYQYYCMGLAQRGFAVINYSYRLAPEHPFPAAVAVIIHVMMLLIPGIIPDVECPDANRVFLLRPAQDAGRGDAFDQLREQCHHIKIHQSSSPGRTWTDNSRRGRSTKRTAARCSGSWIPATPDYARPG